MANERETDFLELKRKTFGKRRNYGFMENYIKQLELKN
jgi:hypothetical protein